MYIHHCGNTLVRVVPVQQSNHRVTLRLIYAITPTLSKLLESYVGRWMVNQLISKLDQKQFGALQG